MAVRIGEVDTSGIFSRPLTLMPAFSRRRFHVWQFPGGKPQRHMVYFAPCVNFFSIFDFKNATLWLPHLRKHCQELS